LKKKEVWGYTPNQPPKLEVATIQPELTAQEYDLTQNQG
jgi:hypothetical protein